MGQGSDESFIRLEKASEINGWRAILKSDKTDGTAERMGLSAVWALSDVHFSFFLRRKLDGCVRINSFHGQDKEIFYIYAISSVAHGIRAGLRHTLKHLFEIYKIL